MVRSSMLLRAKPFPVPFLLLVHSTHTYPPMKMEQTECSETSAYKIQTGNYPKESIQHTEHGKSLKSRKVICYLSVQMNIYPLLFYFSTDRVKTVTALHITAISNFKFRRNNALKTLQHHFVSEECDKHGYKII